MSFPKFLHRYFLLSLALALCLPLHAQTRRRTSRQPEPKVNVSELLQRYAFDKVIAAIDNGKADCTGAKADQIAATARLGADMLNATEKVTVLESRIVPLVDLLNHLPLRGSCAKWESMEQWKAKLNPLPLKLGKVVCINDLRDRIWFAAADSAGKGMGLWTSFLRSEGWSRPIPLPGLQGSGQNRDCPFVMQDGMTVFYAASGEGSLGGTDIFVTRYDPSSRTFLKPESKGMPFCSLDDDFFYAVDETNQLGWFVSNRGCGKDSVRVFTFVPNEEREVVEALDDDMENTVAFATLSNVKLTQSNTEVVKEGRARLEKLLQHPGGTKQSVKRTYVLSDNRIYHSLEEFASPAAKRIAQEADATIDKLAHLLTERDVIQRTYAAGQRHENIRKRLTELNEAVKETQNHLRELEKNYRKAELQQTN